MCKAGGGGGGWNVALSDLNSLPPPHSVVLHGVLTPAVVQRARRGGGCAVQRACNECIECATRGGCAPGIAACIECVPGDECATSDECATGDEGAPGVALCAAVSVQ